MKKSHCQLLIDFFEEKGGTATLRELLENGLYTYGHKLSARIDDLKKRGYEINCVRGELPSLNRYHMRLKPGDTNPGAWRAM